MHALINFLRRIKKNSCLRNIVENVDCFAIYTLCHLLNVFRLTNLNLLLTGIRRYLYLNVRISKAYNL